MLSLLAERTSQLLQSSPRTPKYLCLRDAIIELIVEGVLAEGARLPTEQELAQALPVSLGTVQKALRVLVDSGELHRRRRLGTFVSTGDHRREITTPAFHFVRPDGTRVRMVFIRLKKRERVQRPGQWRDVLGDCDSGYVHLVRQDRIDGTFDCHTEIHLRFDIAASLMDVAAEALEHDSILPLLETSGRIALSQAENRLRMVRLPKAIAHSILADADAPSPWGIRLETLYRREDGTPVAWQVMHIPVNAYSLSLNTLLR
ncbi:MAG: GntR family transcriptional regulator [Halomonas sp.]|nr:GntR family transcriptional regulator [Halomonas sp.]|tara:strand:+ start:449 stop:1228 length:780 start_codon:yes stop_codon:yes gene_type:complete